MLCGVVSDEVHAEGPGGHVGEQGQQEDDADDREDRGVAHHGLDGNDHAEVGVDLVGGDGSADAEGGEEVDRGDGQAAEDDGLGNVARRVLHVAGEGGDDLEAHEVEEDDGEVTQRGGGGEVGQEGVGRHVVGKAVGAGVPDAQAAHCERDGDLEHGAAVEDPLGVRNLEEGHDDDDPHKGELDADDGQGVELEAEDHAQDVGEQGRQRRDPQGEVDPVVPGHARAPFVAEGVAHPVVEAAVRLVGGAQLGNDHAVGQQEGDDQQDPPEELLVADGGSRGRGLGHEHDADHGEDDADKRELLSLHCSAFRKGRESCLTRVGPEALSRAPGP